jgi:hypothetical protein
MLSSCRKEYQRARRREYRPTGFGFAFSTVLGCVQASKPDPVASEVLETIPAYPKLASFRQIPVALQIIGFAESRAIVLACELNTS